MKIQAFTALAVVAALLSITNCAPSPEPEEEEDRSCEKRDADAKKVVSSMDSLKAQEHGAEPSSAPCSCLENLKREETECIFNFGDVIGKCINEDCQHPSSPLYNKTLNVPGGKDGDKKENKDKAAGDGEQKKKDEEGVTEKENEEGGKNEETDLKTEEHQVKGEENIKSEKESSPDAFVGGDSIF
ncbi:unnamed protein product [Ixodes persulcatus]